MIDQIKHSDSQKNDALQRNVLSTGHIHNQLGPGPASDSGILLSSVSLSSHVALTPVSGLFALIEPFVCGSDDKYISVRRTKLH